MQVPYQNTSPSEVRENSITVDDVARVLDLQSDTEIAAFKKLSHFINSAPVSLSQAQEVGYLGQLRRDLLLQQFNTHHYLRFTSASLQLKKPIAYQDKQKTIESLMLFIADWNEFHRAMNQNDKLIDGLEEYEALYDSYANAEAYIELATKQLHLNFSLNEKLDLNIRNDYLDNEYSEILRSLLREGETYQSLMSACMVNGIEKEDEALKNYLAKIGISIDGEVSQSDINEQLAALKMLVGYLQHEQESVVDFCAIHEKEISTVQIREIMPVIAGGGAFSALLEDYAPSIVSIRSLDVSSIDSVLESMNAADRLDEAQLALYENKLLVLCESENVLPQYSDHEKRRFIKQTFIPSTVTEDNQLLLHNNKVFVGLNEASKELMDTAITTIASDEAIEAMVQSVWIQDQGSVKIEDLRKALRVIVRPGSSALTKKDVIMTYNQLTNANGEITPSSALGLQVIYLLGLEKQNSDMVFDLKTDIANFSYDVFKDWLWSYVSLGDPLKAAEKSIEAMEGLDQRQREQMKNTYRLLHQRVEDAINTQYKGFKAAPLEIKMVIIFEILKPLMFLLGPYIALRMLYRSQISNKQLRKIEKFRASTSAMKSDDLREYFNLQNLSDEELEAHVHEPLELFFDLHSSSRTSSYHFQALRRRKLRKKMLGHIGKLRSQSYVVHTTRNLVEAALSDQTEPIDEVHEVLDEEMNKE